MVFLQPRITSGQPIMCPESGATGGIFFENDTRWLTVTDQSDDDYSAAVRFYRVSPTGSSPRKRERWPFPVNGDRCFSREYALGISIYTPNDTDATTLLRDQRPYTGWTYLFRGVSAHDFDQPGFVKSVQSFELYVGIVGPGAGGEDFQNTVHRVANVQRSNGYIRKAEGWHNQLKNEPGIMVGYRRRNRVVYKPMHKEAATDASFDGGLSWLDANVGLAGQLGNVFTHAEGLTGLRIGLNISNDIGPVERLESVPPPARSNTTSLSAPIKRPCCEVYGFVQLRGRLVGRNMSLDGNLFRDPIHRVDKKPIFGEIEGGAVVRLGRAQVTWRTVVRGAEFELQNRLQKFGSLTLAYRGY